MDSQFDPDQFTKPYQLTQTIRRDPYPAISPENPKNSQKGKIVLITGGGSGIGAAAADIWARAGAAGIVIAGRRKEKLESVAKELMGKYKDVRVLAVQTDITEEKDVKKMYAEVQTCFGRQADVVLANAGVMEEAGKVGEQDVDKWWDPMTINLKGLYLVVQHYIKSQEDPTEPIGTVISAGAFIVGSIYPGFSAYTIAKLGEQKLVEFVATEYPSLRIFTASPGLVRTDMLKDFMNPWGLDHVDLLGMLSLYLAQPRADYLKGSFVSVNWDVVEMEAVKAELVEKGSLKTSWLPILPVSGGKGLAK